jgi:hypothetical protein
VGHLVGDDMDILHEEIKHLVGFSYKSIYRYIDLSLYGQCSCIFFFCAVALATVKGKGNIGFEHRDPTQLERDDSVLYGVWFEKPLNPR